MLKSLKEEIAKESFVEDPIAAQMVSSTDDRIKDAILGDIALGAENDESLDQVIEGIPEYSDDEDPEVEAEVEAEAAALESFIEMIPETEFV